LVLTGWLGYGAVPWIALWWAAALLVLMQIFVSLRYWHMRSERFGLLARTTIVQNASRALLPIATALIAPGWAGLVAGETLGRSSGILPLFTLEWTATCRAFRRQAIGAILATLRKYAIFAQVGVPSGLLDAVALALPLPLIAARFGVEAAGQFALAQRVLQAPVGLIGRSVADAFHARLALHARSSRASVPTFFRRTALLLLVFAVVPAAIVLALGSRGFGWVFGARWAQAGSLAVMMVPWTTTQLIVAPLSRAVFVLGGQRQKLLYDISSVLLVLGSYGWSRLSGWGLERTVLCLGVGQAAAYGIYFVLLQRIVHEET
jgi:O-antigen/teichoic acid export membrane protein